MPNNKDLRNILIDEAVPVGSKIMFKGEKRYYTVMASNAFVSVCTKPYPQNDTVRYTIIDWTAKIRGPEDLIFGLGAENRVECEDMLQRVTSGESYISERHCVPLDIEKSKLVRKLKNFL